MEFAVGRATVNERLDPMARRHRDRSGAGGFRPEFAKRAAPVSLYPASPREGSNVSSWTCRDHPEADNIYGLDHSSLPDPRSFS